MAKSKTQYAKLRGTVSYPMVYRPDEFRGKRFWKTNFYPEDDSVWNKINKLGIQSKVKDDSGEFSGVTGKYISIRRDCEKEFRTGLKEFNPPEIYDKDGKPIVTYSDDGERQGEPVLIGNGSLVDMEIEVYEAGSYGKGTRLLALYLIDLIEYIPPEDVEEEEEPEEVKKVEKKTSGTQKKVKW